MKNKYTGRSSDLSSSSNRFSKSSSGRSDKSSGYNKGNSSNRPARFGNTKRNQEGDTEAGARSFGDKGERRGGSSFGGERRPRRDFEGGGERRGGSSFGGERRPRRDFEGGGERRGGSSFGGERRPRRDFEGGGERRGGSSFGGERRPRRDFEGGGERRGGSSFGGERRPRRDFEGGGERRGGSSFGEKRGGSYMKRRTFAGYRSQLRAESEGKEGLKKEFPMGRSSGDRALHKRKWVEETDTTLSAPIFSYQDELGDAQEENFGGPLTYEAKFPMPLNKYVAHCGVCSRREAVDVVKEGRIIVNGVITKTPATKINETDEVLLDKKKISIKQELVYIVMNKPKDYICTADDEKDRKIIYELLHPYQFDGVHSIGRLDRDTTGVLLLTNDGELTQKLSHPSYEITKIYHVSLDKSLAMADMNRIADGLELEDGLAIVDEIAYTNTEDKKEIGIAIHSGKNRIVRRIFEHLGYQVEKLDRVSFAGITKKNIPRGKWRFLSHVEIRNLKVFDTKYQKKS